METRARQYFIDNKEVKEVEFTNELNYQLVLEKRQNISHGKFTQEELVKMVMNNTKSSTFFEVGTKIFKSY